MEIPPRVRRREGDTILLSGADGNTSACAEKSPFDGAQILMAQKYLRVCGEEQERSSQDISARGNTSACAEKSQPRYLRRPHTRKYLRVCGEERRRVT